MVVDRQCGPEVEVNSGADHGDDTNLRCSCIFYKPRCTELDGISKMIWPSLWVRVQLRLTSLPGCRWESHATTSGWSWVCSRPERPHEMNTAHKYPYPPIRLKFFYDCFPVVFFILLFFIWTPLKKQCCSNVGSPWNLGFFRHSLKS